MFVSVRDLLPGDRLSHDVYNEQGLHIMPKGELIDGEGIQLLERHHIHDVNILPRESSNSVGGASSTLKQGLLVFENAIAATKKLFEDSKQSNRLDPDDAEQAYMPFIQSFEKEKDIVALLLMLNNQDDYTYHHCVHVGMIAYFLGKWMGYSEEKALHVGKAGYLHDIGKSKIPGDILHKPAKLTEQEFEMIKKHTVWGYQIIKESMMDDEFALAALQHHERLSGRGYPLQKTGPHIHPYAKIVAVADVYSAMITTRVYQKKRDLLIVLKEIARMSFEDLDPEISHVFIRNMIPNFIGKKVTFSNGQSGKIIMNNPTDYFTPLVQMEHGFVDLSVERSLIIDEISI